MPRGIAVPLHDDIPTVRAGEARFDGFTVQHRADGTIRIVTNNDAGLFITDLRNDRGHQGNRFGQLHLRLER